MNWLWGWWGGASKTPLEEHLEKQAQGNIDEGATLTDDDLVNQVLMTGTDYKGQTNTASHLSSWGLAGEIAGEVGLPFLPGINLNTSAKVHRAPYRFLLVTVQPDDLQSHPNRAPVLAAAMNGVCWKAGLEAKAEMSPFKASDADPSQETRDGEKKDAKDLSFTARAIERLGASFKPKFKISLGGEIAGIYITASDKLPAYLFKNERQHLKEHLLKCIRGQEGLEATKTWDENERCALSLWIQSVETKFDVQASLKATCKHIPDLSIKGLFTKKGRELSVDVSSSAGLDGSYRLATYRLSTLGYNYLMTTQDTRVVFTTIGGTKLGLSASLKLEPKGDEEGEGQGEEEEEDDDGGGGLTVERSEEGSLGGDVGKGIGKYLAGKYKDSVSSTLVDGEKTKLGGDRWDYISSATYTSTVAVWDWKKPEQLLPGSGYVLGRSVAMSLLVRDFYEALPRWKRSQGKKVSVEGQRSRLAQWKRSAPYRYLCELAASLHVEPGDLEKVMLHPNVRGFGLSWTRMSDDEKNSAVGAIIIEAAFACAPSLRGRPGLEEAKESGRLPDIHDIMERTVNPGSGSYRNLEAIRVRIRLEDQAEESSNVFKLGVKFDAPGLPGIALSFLGVKPGLSGSLTLQKESKIEIRGSFDLVVVWFNKMSSFNADTATACPPKSVIPPVLLA